MISKNSFLVLIATFFIAGFICLGLTNKSFSGINPSTLGCCINTAANPNACKGCSGNPPCQRTAGFCDTTNDIFVPNEFCSTVGGGEATCVGQAPEGCCDLGGPAGEGCTIETEADCEEDPDSVDWTFGVSCSEDTCGEPPTGCCVVGIDEVTFLATDDSECIPDTTESDCEGRDGQWTIGGTCDVTLTCLGEGPPPNVISAVPTMSQWGLIATAGIIALFSLFYIVRRKSYNG